MSFIATQIEPGMTEIRLLDNCEEMPTESSSIRYESKIHLNVRNPQRENTFQLVSLGSNLRSQHGKNETASTEVMAGISHVTGNTSSANHCLNTCNSAIGDGHELESDVKVETKSCGKISDLISQFNNVEAGSHRIKKTDHKIPAKKLRLDFQSIIQETPSRADPTLNTPSTSQHPGSSSTIQAGELMLPVVNLNFKVHTDEHRSFHQAVSLQNKIIPTSKQFITDNATTVKPQVKPRSLKNSGTQGVISTTAENQIAVENCVKPSRVTYNIQRPVKEDSRYNVGGSHSNDACILTECDAFRHDRKDCVHTVTINLESCNELLKHESDVKISTVDIDETHREAGTDVKISTVDIDETHREAGTDVKISTVDIDETHREAAPDVKISIVDIDETHREAGTDVKISIVDIDETHREAGTVKDVHRESKIVIPVTEHFLDNNIIPEKSAETTENMSTMHVTADVVSSEHLQTNTEDVADNNGKSINDCINGKQHLPLQTIIQLPHSKSKETINTTTNCLKSEAGIDATFTKRDQHFDDSEQAMVSVSDSSVCDSGFCDSGLEQMSSSDSRDDKIPKTGGRNRMNEMLNMLKSELMTMRKMDLLLLKQLINISQTIHRIHRADAITVSRSLSFLNPNTNLPRRYRPVERQNSAPHCPDRRRLLFSSYRANTEDDYRVSDSLSSFDESEFDSQSEVEASNSSLNSIINHSPRSAADRRKFFQSHDVFSSLDISEDPHQNYEDILRRNVRLWKMSMQRHQSVQEEAALWF